MFLCKWKRWFHDDEAEQNDKKCYECDSIFKIGREIFKINKYLLKFWQFLKTVKFFEFLQKPLEKFNFSKISITKLELRL
jgi:hypothetical protein